MPAGDLTLTTPKAISVTGLQLVQINILATQMEITLREVATGIDHRVVVTDAFAYGVDYSGGVFTDGVVRAIVGEYTKLLGLLFKAGAKTSLTQTLIADGVLTAPGVVT